MFTEIDHVSIQRKPYSDSDLPHKEVYSFKIIYVCGKGKYGKVSLLFCRC